MAITPIGVVLIPLAVGVALFWPQRLLSLLIVLSVFNAASVVNVYLGAMPLGLQPYYLVAFLIAVQAAWSALEGARWLPRKGSSLAPALRTLCKFWLWCVVTAFVLPIEFRGLPVLTPRSGIPNVWRLLATSSYGSASYGSALQWGFGNLAQVLYITVNVAIVFYAARTQMAVDACLLLRALRWAIWIVVFVMFWQRAALVLGFSFPYMFFNNNPAYSQLNEITLGATARLSATFTEPSYAGAFLAAAWLGLLAELLHGGRRRSLYVGIVCVSVALAFSLASTGYAAAVLGALLLFISSRRSHSRGRTLRAPLSRVLIAAGLLVAAVGVLLIIVPGMLNAAVLITYGKIGSVSLLDRLTAEVFSFRILLRTYGLGVGLGSNRPSSLFTYLLSNVGIVGFALFILFIMRTLQLEHPDPRLRTNTSIQFARWFLIGLVIAQAIAIPDLDWPPLWMALIVLLAMLHPTADSSRKRTNVSVQVTKNYEVS